MLAHSYMTAADLGISEEGRQALITVLGMLDRAEIEYDEISRRPMSVQELLSFKPQFFNMALVEAPSKCGTAACILGWAKYVSGEEGILPHDDDPELENLFRMGLGAYEMDLKASSKITPQEAAYALRNYLTTGKANWRLVMEASAAASVAF